MSQRSKPFVKFYFQIAAAVTKTKRAYSVEP
jgi:hypothetical protein